MEDKMQHVPNNTPTPTQTQQHGSEKTEPVRSRWTPKPEQILILESIFNSGMVNPLKEETIKIRTLLEKFGNVGDANIFYWFQNRRSRSRRRQRQIQQATLDQQRNQMVMLMNNHHDGASSNITNNPSCGENLVQLQTNPIVDFGSSSSSSCAQQGMDAFFSVSSQMDLSSAGIIDPNLATSSLLFPPNFNYGYGCGASGGSGSGMITVFINGIATEIEAGPIDMKTVFGEDVMLLHSSGVPLPTNQYGFLTHTLNHGEAYFLVSKSSQV